MAQRAVQMALLSAGVAATGLLGYAVYFDYMRRHSPEFRKNIRRGNNQVKARAVARAKAEQERNSKAIKEMIRSISAEPVPPPSMLESYFNESLSKAEILFSEGSEQYFESAAWFYRAFRVYPDDPLPVLKALAQAMPPAVFKLVMDFMEAGGSAATAGGSRLGASVAEIDDSDIRMSDTTSSPTGLSSGNGDWDRLSD